MFSDSEFTLATAIDNEAEQTILVGANSATWLVNADVDKNKILGDARTVMFNLMAAPEFAVSPAELKIV